MQKELMQSTVKHCPHLLFFKINYSKRQLLKTPCVVKLYKFMEPLPLLLTATTQSPLEKGSQQSASTKDAAHE